MDNLDPQILEKSPLEGWATVCPSLEIFVNASSLLSQHIQSHLVENRKRNKHSNIDVCEKNTSIAHFDVVLSAFMMELAIGYFIYWKLELASEFMFLLVISCAF